MPNGQDWGQPNDPWQPQQEPPWQQPAGPQQGYGQQYPPQGQPWQPPQYDPAAHQRRVQGAPQEVPWQQGTQPLPQGQPWQQPGYGQQPYMPPQPPRRKSWPDRHKVLTGFLAFCGLVFIIGIAAAASSSSSSSTPVSPTSRPSAGAGLVATASPTARKTTTAAQTTTAARSTSAQATASAQTAAPSTPIRTTPAAAPVTPASTAPAGCHPLTNAGNCYEPGEYCRTSDHGTSGVAGDGEAIICENNDGWRWEPA